MWTDEQLLMHLGSALQTFESTDHKELDTDQIASALTWTMRYIFRHREKASEAEEALTQLKEDLQTFGYEPNREEIFDWVERMAKEHARVIAENSRLRDESFEVIEWGPYCEPPFRAPKVCRLNAPVGHRLSVNGQDQGKSAVLNPGDIVDLLVDEPPDNTPVGR